MKSRFFRALPWFLSSLACLWPGWANAAQEDAWPSRPVKIIVPYPAGGIVDVVVRIVTEKISSNSGQPIVVENHSGANGEIGASIVKKAKPDGHTLLAGSSSLVTNFIVNPNARISYTDYVPVGTVGLPPNIAAVPASSSARTLKEFIAYAKANPGKVNATNPGVGSSNHQATEVLQSTAGIELTQINYKGQPPSIPDLLNGQLGFAFISAGLASPHVRSGRLRPLAVAYSKRLKNYPNVPTVDESGYPELGILPWAGFFAPKGTPATVIGQIAAQVEKALDDPDVIARYEMLEAVNPGLFLDDFARFLRNDEARWRKIVTERNIKLE